MILLHYFMPSLKLKYPEGYIIPRTYEMAKMLKMACTANFPTNLVYYQRERCYFAQTHLKLHEFKHLYQFTKEWRKWRKWSIKSNILGKYKYCNLTESNHFKEIFIHNILRTTIILYSSKIQILPCNWKYYTIYI